MKYRAICPGCGIRLSRKLIFRRNEYGKQKCPSCGCYYIADLTWDYAGSAILALPVGVFYFLARFHKISWTVAAMLSLTVVLIGYALFPYITPFVLDKEKQKHERVLASAFLAVGVILMAFGTHAAYAAFMLKRFWFNAFCFIFFTCSSIIFIKKGLLSLRRTRCLEAK